MTSGQVGDLYWHVHHNVLAEVLTEPIEARIAYVNAKKPKHERATRLRWMSPVLTLDDPGWAALRSAEGGRRRAQADLRRAWVTYDRAHTKPDRAQADLDRAQADLNRAWAALEPLHATEHPGCPWDGRTLVFPEVTP